MTLMPDAAPPPTTKIEATGKGLLRKGTVLEVDEITAEGALASDGFKKPSSKKDE